MAGGSFSPLVKLERGVAVAFPLAGLPGCRLLSPGFAASSALFPLLPGPAASPSS
jgi:hypothetical protein